MYTNIYIYIYTHKPQLSNESLWIFHAGHLPPLSASNATKTEVDVRRHESCLETVLRSDEEILLDMVVQWSLVVVGGGFHGA